MSKLFQPKILVAMPAYNEEKYIGSLVLKAQRCADEVLVVDDGSKDGTSETAMLAGATVIRYEENRGKGAAIQRILAEARKRNPDIVVLLDADSQHDPEDIPFLIEPISRGFDIVIGSRVRQRSNIPPYRRFGQRVLSYLSSVLSGEMVEDSECGFRALSPKAVAKLELRQNGFAIEAEMISIATEKGLAITEVPISALYTKDGSTMNPVRHGFGVLTNILKMISERQPLFFFGLGGGILVVLGLIAGIRTLSILSAGGNIPIGTTLISVLLLTVGMFSIFTGVVLHTLTRRKG
jgi:glycosyltransferase involved in cell wall biosynthesis